MRDRCMRARVPVWTAPAESDSARALERRDDALENVSDPEERDEFSR
jgi:hypothetical protein